MTHTSKPYRTTRILYAPVVVAAISVAVLLSTIGIASANNIEPTCEGKTTTEGVRIELQANVTIYHGTKQADVIVATTRTQTQGPVVVHGKAGNDTICIVGHQGTVWGGPGTDTLIGGPHSDTLNGGGHADTIRGNAGTDLINGGWGDDTIRGNAGTDLINGGWGNDSLYGGWGNDTIDGGNGEDTAWGYLGADACTTEHRNSCGR